MARRRQKAEKRRGGFGKTLFVFLLGLTVGSGAAAYVAFRVNETPLPFISPPTRSDDGAPFPARPDAGEDVLQYPKSLRKGRAPAAADADGDEPDAATRRFVYYLQLGAFRERAAAEELRGQIAFGGFQAEIREASLASGEKLFRIWLGPYEKERDAEEQRALLAQDGHQASLLQLAAGDN